MNGVQKETIRIDQIIIIQQSNMRLYLIWFLLTIIIGLLLLIAFTLTLVSETIGVGIGGALILIIAKPPLTEILRYRDRIGVLKSFKPDLISLDQNDPNFINTKNHINEIIIKFL
jgi:hypothetical protein